MGKINIILNYNIDKQLVFITVGSIYIRSLSIVVSLAYRSLDKKNNHHLLIFIFSIICLL